MREEVVWQRGPVYLVKRSGRMIKCKGFLAYMYDREKFGDPDPYYVLRFTKPLRMVREYVYAARPTRTEILRQLRTAPRFIEAWNGVHVLYSALRKEYRAPLSPGVKTLAEARAQAAAKVAA